MIPDVHYRLATAADARAAARVLVLSWKESFAGIVPDDFLQKLTIENKSIDLRQRFSDADYRMYVAELDDHQVIGFADVGLPRHDVGSYDVELHAIYCLHEFQGKGIGRRLFEGMKEFLIAKRKTSMYLLALEVSPYRPFYEKLGGRVVGKKQVALEGVNFNAVVYGWTNLV